MTWHRLIPVSVGCAFIMAGGVATLAPNSAAAAETQECGEHNGKLCHKDCLRECSNGTCCELDFQYYRQ